MQKFNFVENITNVFWGSHVNKRISIFGWTLPLRSSMHGILANISKLNKSTITIPPSRATTTNGEHNYYMCDCVQPSISRNVDTCRLKYSWWFLSIANIKCQDRKKCAFVIVQQKVILQWFHIGNLSLRFEMTDVQRKTAINNQAFGYGHLQTGNAWMKSVNLYYGKCKTQLLELEIYYDLQVRQIRNIIRFCHFIFLICL